MWLAIVHVVGALGSSFAFGCLVLFFDVWNRQRMLKLRLREATVALGVPVSLESLHSLDIDDSVIPPLIKYSSQRFSSELLRNRLSDVCGALVFAWGWLSNLLQVGIAVFVGWEMFALGAHIAVYMWLVLAVSVLFWLAHLAFFFLCAVLTGRYPGEAKAARKATSELIEKRHAGSARPLASP